MNTDNGALNFDANINNEKLIQSINEAEKRIKGFSNATVKEGEKIEDAFKVTADNIRIQKDVIASLENEVKNLNAEIGKMPPGKAQDQLRQQAAQVTAELKAETEALKMLESEVQQNEKAHQSFRSQLRQAREELIRMEQAGLRGTPAYDALQKKVGELTDAMSDAQAQATVLANDERGFQGVISAVSGVTGAMSAAQGAVGLFAGENENLNKIMLKVQSLMAITIGLQQVAETLNKDSYFSIVILGKAKEMLAVAETKVATAMGVSTVAARVLMATLTLGLSVAITAIIIAINKLQTKQAEAKKAQEEFNKAVAETAGEPVSAINMLAAQWKSLGNDMSAKKKFVDDNQKAFADLGVSIKSVADAENLLITNKDAFIEAQIAKAKAIAAGEKAADLAKENIDNQLKLDEARKKPTITRIIPSTTPGIQSGTYTTANPDIAKFEKKQKEIDAKIKKYYDLSLTNQQEADKKMKDAKVTAIKEETEAEKKAREEREKVKKDQEEKTKKNQQALEQSKEDFDKAKLEQQKKAYDDEIELKRSQIADKKALIDFELAQTIKAIDDEEKLFKHKAAKAGVKNPDLSGFTTRRNIATSQAEVDKAAIDAELAKEQQEKEKEREKQLLENFASFLGKKLELEQQYENDRKLIQGKIDSSTSESEKAELQAVLNNRKKALDDGVKKLQEEVLDENGKGLIDLYFTGDGSDFIQAKIKEAMPLFENIADLTNSELVKLEKIIGEIGFTPEQLDAFKQAGIDVEKLNTALKNVKKSSSEAVDENKWENVLESAKQMAASVSELGDALEEVGGAAGEIGSALKGIAGQADNLSVAFSKTASAEDQAAAGISAISSLVSMVAGQIAENKRAQEEWNAKIKDAQHQMAMLRIEAQAYQEDNVFGIENPYAKAISGAKQYMQATKELYAATAALETGQVQTGTKKVTDWGNVGKGAAAGAVLGTFIPGVGNLVGAGIGALVGGIIGLATRKTVPVFESLKAKYGEVVDSAGNLNQQIIADYDKLDEATKKLVDNWEEIKEKQKEAQEQMKENFRDLAGDLGTSLSDALVEAFANGNLYSAIDKFDAKMNDVISNIVSQLIFSSIFGQMFDDLENRFNESFGEGGDQNLVDDLTDFGKNYKNNLDAYNQAMTMANEEMKRSGLTGFTPTGGNQSGLTGAIQNVTEETASIISGQLNAIRINQVESVSIIRNQLMVLNQISSNTAYNINLVEILGVLKSIASGDSLRSQGL